MKRIISIGLTLLLLGFPTALADGVQFAPQGDVIAYEENGRVGLKGLQGNVLLEAQYDEIMPFDDMGYARIIEGDLSGVVSADGRVVVPPEWPLIFGLANSGFAVGCESMDAQQTLLNLRTGEAQLTAGEGEALEVYEDCVYRIRYGANSWGYEPPFETTVFDGNLNERFSIDALLYGAFADGIVTAQFSDGSYGFVREDGVILADGLESLSRFDDGSAYATYAVKRDGRQFVGCADRDGNRFETEGYAIERPDEQGLCVVQLNENSNAGGWTSEDRYVYVDLSGERALPEEYQRAFPFVDGAAIVMRDHRYMLIDRQGEQVGDLAWQWSADEGIDGLVTASAIVVEVDGGYRFANRRGEWLSNRVWSEAPTLISNACFVCDDGAGNKCFVGMDGESMFDFTFEAAYTAETGPLDGFHMWRAPARAGLTWVKHDGQWGLFDTVGEQAGSFVSDARYSEIEGDSAQLLDGETWVYIDALGRPIAPRRKDEASFS